MFTGRDVDRLVPGRSLLTDLGVDADLHICHSKEVPRIRVGAGGECAFLAPPAAVVSYAVDVLRLWLQPRHCGLVRVEKRRVVRARRGFNLSDTVRVVCRPVLDVLCT